MQNMYKTFRVVNVLGTTQLEVADPTGRLRKVNISDIYKILPADFIVTCIPDKQLFARKGKYINDPHLLKKISVTDAFLQDCFHN